MVELDPEFWVIIMNWISLPVVTGGMVTREICSVLMLLFSVIGVVTLNVI